MGAAVCSCTHLLLGYIVLIVPTTSTANPLITLRSGPSVTVFSLVFLSPTAAGYGVATAAVRSILRALMRPMPPTWDGRKVEALACRSMRTGGGYTASISLIKSTGSQWTTQQSGPSALAD